MKKSLIFLYLIFLLGAVSLAQAAGETCSDGTVHGACSSSKEYCENGNFTDKCSECGCPSDKECDKSTETCVACTEGWTCKELTVRGLKKADCGYEKLENCPAGCYEGVCNPDPCTVVVCNDVCFNDVNLNQKGFCVEGICIYKKLKCEDGCVTEGNVSMCAEDKPAEPELISEPEPESETTNETPQDLPEVIEDNESEVMEDEPEVMETEPEEKGFFQKIFGFFSFLKFWG